MSLEPIQNNEKDDTSSILFKCPYCPRSFQNNMTLHVLNLHMMKVHRIQCVESFTCPKCKHRVLDSGDATVSIDTKENIDPNIANQGNPNLIFGDSQCMKTYITLFTPVANAQIF